MEKTNKIEYREVLILPPCDFTLLGVLAEADMSGDVYLPINEAINRCIRKNSDMDTVRFYNELTYLLARGYVVEEHDRLYRRENIRYEKAAAKRLANLMSLPPLHVSKTLDASLAAAETMLPEELDESQREAVLTCLSNRLTIVTGGAGSGKTTMVRALNLTNQILEPRKRTLLCAPTGKAARNLGRKALYPSSTIHRALGKIPDSDFLGAGGYVWANIDLVVVDEASMVTLEMLAGILEQASPNSHMVLIGDPNQLPAVGSGNVLSDLITLGLPHVHLTGNHRQEASSGALYNNIMEFNTNDSVTLEFDENFRLVLAYSGESANEQITALHKSSYEKKEDVQVVSPFRSSSAASVASLNRALQNSVNPPSSKKLELDGFNCTFRDGDRVMLTENTSRFCNGDVGILMLKEHCMTFSVDFGFGIGTFEFSEIRKFTLAYACTIHKAQGSEYETVIVPMLKEFGVMLNPRLFYTAISRATTKLIIVGNMDAIQKALYSLPAKRYSTLVDRVSYILSQHEHSQDKASQS